MERRLRRAPRLRAKRQFRVAGGAANADVQARQRRGRNAAQRENPGKQPRQKKNRHVAVATRASRVNRGRACSPLGDVPMLNHGGIDFDDTEFGPEEE